MSDNGGKNKGPCCGNCDYVRQVSGEQGVCCRYPPHLVMSQQQHLPGLALPNGHNNGPTRVNFMYGYPSVRITQWCGEYGERAAE